MSCGDNCITCSDADTCGRCQSGYSVRMNGKCKEDGLDTVDIARENTVTIRYKSLLVTLYF